MNVSKLRRLFMFTLQLTRTQLPIAHVCARLYILVCARFYARLYARHYARHLART